VTLDPAVTKEQANKVRKVEGHAIHSIVDRMSISIEVTRGNVCSMTKRDIDIVGNVSNMLNDVGSRVTTTNNENILICVRPSIDVVRAVDNLALEVLNTRDLRTIDYLMLASAHYHPISNLNSGLLFVSGFGHMNRPGLVWIELSGFDFPSKVEMRLGNTKSFHVTTQVFIILLTTHVERMRNVLLDGRHFTGHFFHLRVVIRE